MNLTVGPHPPAVYWRRRALVAGGLLLLILLVVWSCGGSSGSLVVGAGLDALAPVAQVRFVRLKISARIRVVGDDPTHGAVSARGVRPAA